MSIILAVAILSSWWEQAGNILADRFHYITNGRCFQSSRYEKGKWPAKDCSQQSHHCFHFAPKKLQTRQLVFFDCCLKNSNVFIYSETFSFIRICNMLGGAAHSGNRLVHSSLQIYAHTRNYIKKRVLVQNKSNLLLNIIFYNTGTLQLFIINIINLKRKIYTKDN